ncbi:hypothetical protein GCM10012275_05490 [Longimycelium tulufanense]|uniref:TIGR02234 family membrane protein n=1 Tax=Longimycelium tulufanense TaxID=907463 RepID=A0A8J3CC10_9PSEU|nr:Trp biosynthesis-associated membrane protein [Longimycelium tulufanense]GGM37309.1 hypothetical protein GCM10012275_05490 [Longimycelium tulufanense]
MADRAGGGARRALWLAVVLLLGAAAALWGSSRLTWLAMTEERPGGGVATVIRQGAEQAPQLVPLALVALAAVAALVATGGWLRRGIGVLLLVVGAWALWTALSPVDSGYPGDVPVAQRAELDRARVERPWARVLAAGGGALLLGAGAATLWWGPRMPRMGARYQAPSGARRQRDPQRRMWDAIDAGEDPTVDRPGRTD